MKLLTAIFSILFLASPAIVLAADYPDGDITFYNASNNSVKAEVSPTRSFTLASNESKTIAYSSLSYVCSNPCKAKFYVNNAPAGSATIDVAKGRFLKMNLAVKVSTTKSAENVLRTVVIK